MLIRGFGKEKVLRVGQSFSMFAHTEKITVFLKAIIQIDKNKDQQYVKVSEGSYALVILSPIKHVFLDEYKDCSATGSFFLWDSNQLCALGK